jgi:succinate dehydrogenase / fumarate reductase cytochrome b subunit
MAKPRPLSPHLQVYDMLRITSLTSILHRLTGAALVIGTLIIVWWLMAVAHGPQAYADFNHTIQRWYFKLVLVGFTWAFWYQLINGIRHLFWDAGIGFDHKIFPVTGKLALIASVIATIATWWVL